MIDWITAVVPFRHTEPITGGRIVSISSDGELQWESAKAQEVVGSHDTNLHIRSHRPGFLWISGNPIKWFQGHNLFGTDDLHGLVRETIFALARMRGVVPALSDIVAIERGEYTLSRVDCCAMWELPCRADARSWLRALEFQAKSRHGRATSRGGTVYFGQKSRRWALKFYSKGDELEARGKGHSLSYEIPQRDRLIAYASNKLRGELTLRQMELKKLALDTGAMWLQNPSISRVLLLDHIASLQMSDQFTLTPELLQDLPPRLILVYKAWKAGEDIRGMFPLRTFYRYRGELLKRGIDIGIRQPKKADKVVPLVRVLRPEAIADAPDWAKGTPLLFEPRKNLKRA
jgi:II/X family phage/plasmid replication protein